MIIRFAFQGLEERQMGFSRLLFFFLVSTVNLCFASALDNFDVGCDPCLQKTRCITNFFNTGSIYEANLERLAFQFSSTKEFNFGFYNLTIGLSPNQVNAIGLCRGDIKQDACKSCLNETIPKLQQSCVNRIEAVGWSDLCMLRYSNQNIFGVKQTVPDKITKYGLNVSNVDKFNPVLSFLLNNLSSQAAAGDTVSKYAAGHAAAPDNLGKVYAYAQCTPDLSQQECSDCLETAIGKIGFCHGSIGCKVLQPSCNFRYETGPFLNVTDGIIFSPPSSSPPPTEGKGRSNRTSPTIILVVVVASAVGVFLLLLLCIWICLRLRKSKKRDDNEVIMIESLKYDLATVQAATNNFCDENKLGQGGYGVVYKGQLPNKQFVAVKRLSCGSEQGDREFKNEVLLMAKLQHRNLVRLLGFCLEGKERLLIYEFMPNASLDQLIFDQSKRGQLNWERCCKIIGGIARGLLYLHEDSQLRVIHRDLKPSNILLDAEMNPKISDFGMAALYVADETHDTTKRVVGTYGYMAPEYVKHGHFSAKSDVFSFGILIFEIISGQKNSSCCDGENAPNLINLAWKNWREGMPLNFVDPNLKEGKGSLAEITKCIHIGLLCVQESALHRPTMGSIVVMLPGNSIILPTPSQPAFFSHNTSQSDIGSWQEAHRSTSELLPPSICDVTITEPYPR